MQYLIYFLIAIAATTAGSMTGMGGGVIIKPVMDVLHDFDVETIGIMSSITVFSMSLVSVGKQAARIQAPFQIAVPLGIGSVIGGYVGQQMLTQIVEWLGVQNQVVVIQNVMLVFLILVIFIYMKRSWNLFLLSGDWRRAD